jgi:hypothetical protein
LNHLLTRLQKADLNASFVQVEPGEDISRIIALNQQDLLPCTPGQTIGQQMQTSGAIFQERASCVASTAT